MPALEMALMLLIEPILNPIWTWVVRGEEPGVPTLVGGALILGATAIRTIRSRLPEPADSRQRA
jgi:drug/metabolite transporter (DMT)-like permease